MKPLLFLFLMVAGLLALSSCKNAPPCSDGVQNGYETGIDCGGPDCPPCAFCNDGVQNGREEGPDCGGPDCPPCAVNIEWSTYAEMPTPRAFMAGTLYDGKIYIAGGDTLLGGGTGLKIVEVFDPANKTWDTLPDLNVARVGHAIEEVGGRLYVLGGFVVNNPFSIPSIEIYDPVLKRWEIIENAMSPARAVFGSCVYEGKIYVVGGATGLNVEGAEYLKTAQVYDPESGEWADLPDLSAPRYSVKAVVWNDKIYAIGGGDEPPLPPIEVYDPAHPELGWVIKRHLIIPRRLPTSACLVIDDLIYCIGGLSEKGYISSFNWCLSSVEAYAPQLDSSFIATSMHFRRQGHVSCVWQDQILIFGGIESAGLNAPCIPEVERGVVVE